MTVRPSYRRLTAAQLFAAALYLLALKLGWRPC